MNTLKRNEQNENETNNWSVYVHINIMNNKKYIGITSRDPILRWQNGTAYKRNPHFNAAIKKYGWDSFKHIILHTNLSHDCACKYEKEYIKIFNLRNKEYGYNMTDGGEGISGYSFSDRQRNTFSRINSGKNNPCYGRVGEKHPMYGKHGEMNPNYGRKATKEQRSNISKGRKGIVFSPEHLEHMKLSAKRGKDNNRSKSVSMCDLNDNTIMIFETISAGAEQSGADVSNIVKCCRGKIKSAAGYIWHYVN